MTVRSLIQPYLKCARFLATWLRIRIMMGITMGVSLALMIISGVQMASDGGSSGVGGWSANICSSIPYTYLKPFSFTLGSGSNPSYCGWPDQNTDIRLVGAVFGFLFVFALFFKSRLSNYGRTVMITFTSLHFASFVLDASQCAAGANACTNKFPNTGLGTTIGGQTVNCDSVNYPGLTVLNFIQVILYYLLFETWSMCGNLYNTTADDDDDDDKPKKTRRKRRDGDEEDDDEEDGNKTGKSTRNPLQDFDEEDGGEDEDGNPRKGYKKLTPEQAAALEKQSKSHWCPLL